MFTGKLGKIALSLVNMDVLPEIMHDSFPRRYMGVGASLRRRSPRAWMRYRENVRRFLDALPTPFYEPCQRLYSIDTRPKKIIV